MFVSLWASALRDMMCSMMVLDQFLILWMLLNYCSFVVQSSSWLIMSWNQIIGNSAVIVASFRHRWTPMTAVSFLVAPEGFQGHQPGALHARRRQRHRLPAGRLQQPHGHQTDAALEQAGSEGVPGLGRPAQSTSRQNQIKWNTTCTLLWFGTFAQSRCWV